MPSSVLCLGTASFGSGLDRFPAFRLLDSFFEHGGNFIDTAHVYGVWVPGGLGLSETIVGQWVKERGRREQVIIATKGAHPDLSSMHISRLSRQDIIADLDESLRCLQTEPIDLYRFYRDDPCQPVSDLLELLNAQVAIGKIRAFGWLNWHGERIAEALDYATRHGMTGFVGNQLMWSFAKPNREALTDTTVITMDEPTFEFHPKTGLLVAAYTSQARGFFPDPLMIPCLFLTTCASFRATKKIPDDSSDFNMWRKLSLYPFQWLRWPL